MLSNVPIVVRFGIIDRGVNTIVFSRRDRRHMAIVECGEFRHPRESRDRGDGSVHFVELSYSVSILVNKVTRGWTCAVSCGTLWARNRRGEGVCFSFEAQESLSLLLPPFTIAGVTVGSLFMAAKVQWKGFVSLKCVPMGNRWARCIVML